MPVTLRIPDGASLLLEVSAFTVDHNGDVNNVISYLYPWGSADAAEKVESCQTALEGSRIVYKPGLWRSDSDIVGVERDGPAVASAQQAKPKARGRLSEVRVQRRAMRNIAAAAGSLYDLRLEQRGTSPDGAGTVDAGRGKAGQGGANRAAAIARAQLRVSVASDEQGIYNIASQKEAKDVQMAPRQLEHFVAYRTHTYSLVDVATASELPLFYLQQSNGFLHVAVPDLRVGAFMKDTRSVVPGAVSCVRVINHGDLQIIASLKVLARRSQLPVLLLPYAFHASRRIFSSPVYRQHPLLESCRMPKPEGTDLVPAPRGEVNALLTGALTLHRIDNFPFSGRFFLELDFHLGAGWRVRREAGEWMDEGRFPGSPGFPSPGSRVPEIKEINADLNVATIGPHDDRPYWYYRTVISQREPATWSVTSQIFVAKKGKSVHVSLPVIDLQKCIGMLYLPPSVPLCSPGYVTATLFRVGKAGTVFHTAASSILQLPQAPGAYNLSATLIVPRYKNYWTVEKGFYGYSAIGTGIDYQSNNAASKARGPEGAGPGRGLIRGGPLGQPGPASSAAGMAPLQGFIAPLSAAEGRLEPSGTNRFGGDASAGGMAAALGQFSASALKFARTLVYALTGFFSIEVKSYLRFRWLACHCVPRNVVSATRLLRSATTGLDLASSLRASRMGLMGSMKSIQPLVQMPQSGSKGATAASATERK